MKRDNLSMRKFVQSWYLKAWNERGRQWRESKRGGKYRIKFRMQDFGMPMSEIRSWIS